ncbi:transient receptor potential cation channel subfamily V member 5-like [Ylistrum balloti]|uniref:transient receptor potential cation channel subfamily V member 5-like n=1 Tax=Ylistrum balloti TaxID=509963 RepID=UPI002905B47A|nr:transient receptor potential cation channel subfamily V member 5-like [Ylistrum balloti]
MEKLQAAIERKNVQKTLDILHNNASSNIFRSNLTHHYCSYEERGKPVRTTDDTILHLAAAHLDESQNVIIQELVKLSPELLERRKQNGHQGQTPLHILIVRNQNETLRKIKDLLSSDLTVGDTVRNNIFNPKVTGALFSKTVMEGELPYIVAALTLDTKTARLVIEMTGQHIKAQNGKGNTVYHCLVEHAARHPNKIPEVTAMWDFLSSFGGENAADLNDLHRKSALAPKYAFKLSNHENMRPLQLAAKHGVPQLFNVILDHEKIPNVKDKLFDSYLYDISVIDTVTHFKVQRKKKVEMNHSKPNKVGPCDDTLSLNPAAPSIEEVGREIEKEKFQYSQSVLEMVCNAKIARNNSSVFDIIKQPPMKKLIDLKWKTYRTQFFLWMFYHAVVMVWYSIYAIQWASVTFPSNSTQSAITNVQRAFVSFSSISLILTVGVPYFACTVLLIVARCLRPNTLQYLKTDIEYIVLLFLFSFCLLVDGALYHINQKHDSYFLLISNLSGWWFCIFYCRAFRSVSFYVAMIQKVIFGDLLRFGLFILLSLVSFTIAFQVLFQGIGVPTAYGSEDTTESIQVFAGTLLTNTRLMFGLVDIEVLYQAREPVLAYIVYMVYVTMTYLVLLNSLIAMISETCAKVRENDIAFFHTQRLSVILFLEEISYPFWRLSETFIPNIPFETRPVKRNGVVLYHSYFLKMTDKQSENEQVDETPNAFNQPVQQTESVTVNIQQPFYEEYIDNENKKVSVLKWGNGQSQKIARN